jgi:Zn-dependent M28 family amino/carboxypeptidase
MAEAIIERLQEHVHTLAGVIGERNIYHPAALEAAEHYISEQWEAQGYGVTRQEYLAQGVASANLEVSRPGMSRPGEILLLGAHYDSVYGSPGADDNASGVAALLEIGRLLRERECVRTIRLVAFVNEEPPFFFWGQMGSKVYAEAARRRGDDIRLMVSLEMLGCYSDAPGSQSYPTLFRYFHPSRGNFLAFVSNLRSRQTMRGAAEAFRRHSDLPLESTATFAWVPGVAWSDHLSFWRQGYRAFMATDTAFYRYPHYHSASDTADRLDYVRLARATEGLAGVAVELAGHDRL